MSQSRWRYWIGDDGVARIRQEDMPRPVTIELGYDKEKNPLKITLREKMNPDYYEFKTEIFRVTGKKEIIVIEKGKAEKPE